MGKRRRSRHASDDAQNKASKEEERTAPEPRAEKAASPPSARARREDLTSLRDVLGVLQRARNIVVVTGAGISVSCGIPDFRGANGIYDMIEKWDLELPSPEALFDIEYFDDDPQPFYRFARTLFPGSIRPSKMHRFLAALERQGKLLRNYTQNIDGLERVAGLTKYVACHGSLDTATCRAKRCRYSCPASEIYADVMRGRVPQCRRRECGGVLKPDVVFFGEALPKAMSKALNGDRKKADCILIIGTSLAVAPISTVLGFFPETVPQIAINKVPIKPPKRVSEGFDAQLLGEADEVAEFLAEQLGLGLPEDAKPEPVHVSDADAEQGKGAGPDPNPGPNPGANPGPGSDPLSAVELGAKEAAIPTRTKAKAWAAEPRQITAGVFAFSTAGLEVGAALGRPRDALPKPAAACEPMDIIFCDGCDRRLQPSQKFFSCKECFGFDLCERCFRGKHGHAAHGFTAQVVGR